MSEKITPRAETWDADKAQHEQDKFEQAVYGNAGKTLFTERAKMRVETGDQYYQHMADMADRDDAYDTIDDGRLDSIDRAIQADPSLRRAAMIADNIRVLGDETVSVKDADKKLERHKALQDKLEELLLAYDQSSDAHTVQKEEIVGRIINRTVEAPEGEVSPDESDTSSDQEKQDAGKTKFEVGQRVTVRRTSGDLEDDWTVSGVVDGVVTVTKPSDKEGASLVKRIAIDELADLQEDQASKEDDESGVIAESETGELSADSTSGSEHVVDTGDDLEDIEIVDTADGSEDSEDGATTVDTRGRGARAIAEGRRLLQNWRHPFVYLRASMNTAAVARAEARANGELSNNRRRNIIAGVVAGAAIAGMALWLGSKGHDGNSTWNDIAGGAGKKLAEAGKKAADAKQKINEAGGGTSTVMDTYVTIPKGGSYIHDVLGHLGVKNPDQTYMEYVKTHGGTAKDILLGDTTYHINSDLAGTNDGIGAPGRYQVDPDFMSWLKSEGKI